MGKRALKRRIESLHQRIFEHEIKIGIELHTLSPDLGLIDHWKSEIKAFKSSISRAQKRLKG
jgi:hypothetical protein